jgi:hypothetical protein
VPYLKYDFLNERSPNATRQAPCGAPSPQRGAPDRAAGTDGKDRVAEPIHFPSGGFAADNLPFSLPISCSRLLVLMSTEDPAPRRLYPAVDDPGALRVELRSLQGIRARGVALIVTDDPATGDERERPVRIVLTSAQGATIAQRLLAVIDEM